VLPAPPARVFRAWTDPEHLAAWWGPKGMRAGVVELDLRKGGRWRSSMIGADGTEMFVGGVYREIVRPRRLVFTWAWESDGEPGHESVVTLEFNPHPDGTELVLSQAVFETKKACSMHRQGWNSSFDCLAEFLAGKSSKAARQG
jgi:uncharacterized protein YndB with AHSA1/START domain